MSETMGAAIKNGLLWGIALSVYFTLALLLLYYINPELLLHDYPPDVRTQYGAVQPKTKQQRILLFPLFMAGVLTILGLSILALRNGEFLPFGAVMASLFTTCLIFNVFDLLILDWLVFVTLRPSFIVLKDTQNLAGYRDYGFHLRGFIIGLGWGLIVAVVGSGYIELFQVISGR